MTSSPQSPSGADAEASSGGEPPAAVAGQAPATAEKQDGVKAPDPEISFSDNAEEAFYESADQYVLDLTDLSRTLMRRTGVDVVSETHVRSAANILASRSSRWQAKTLGTVGGVVLGAGLGIVGSVMAEEQPVWTSASVAITVATCTIGSILVTVGALRE